MSAKEIKLGDRSVGPDYPPFIIAEMSGNHNQSLDRALSIVDAAADAGAHGLKIQTYTAETMTLDLSSKDFIINDPDSLWDGNSLYELYQQAHTPWEWHEDIFRRCREKGLIGFSTPFDLTAVEFLEKLDIPCYKIASFENTDIPLLKKIAATGKPIIMSTGMATIAELGKAVQTIKEEGNDNIILLKCTSTYPATPENSNIRTISHMRDLFGVQVGLSDHSMGLGVAVAAIAEGAVIVEKHFTLGRADGGIDSAFSIEPDELKSLIVETERAWQAIGKVSYGPVGNEKKSLQFRRSLYVVKDMKKGDKFTPENLRIIRPGFGLPPEHYDSLLGMSVVRDIKKGTAVTWDILK
jgi:N-acetylneuraminate synthase